MYIAVIDVRIEVHEEKDGKCSGKTVPPQELAQKQLSPNMLVRIDGATKNDCLTKLQEWIKNAR